MISEPPLSSLLPVTDEQAGWSKPWGNFFTQIWLQLTNLTGWQTVTVTAAYAAQLSDSVILINGDVTVTLPTAAKGQGKRITCKAINAGGGTRTVSGNGSNIDGAATWTTTTQYVSQDFVSNGTQWFTV